MRTKTCTHKGLRSQGRRRPLKKATLLALDLLLLAALIISVAILLSVLAKSRASREAYRELGELVLITPAPATPTPAPTATGAAVFAEDAASATETPLSAASPEINVKVDWYKLNKLNRYVKAWLYCPDTAINYPVVQYKDNSYFLDHDFERHSDEAGTLFFDCSNVFSEGNENWIIYGHRRNDGSMFGSLKKYAKRDYFEAHPAMYLILRKQTYRVEIFACRTVHVNQKYFKLWFDTDARYQQYLDRALEQSYWQPDQRPSVDYPVLTLATCSNYDGDNEPRLLVHGMLIPLEDEG